MEDMGNGLESTRIFLFAKMIRLFKPYAKINYYNHCINWSSISLDLDITHWLCQVYEHENSMWNAVSVFYLRMKIVFYHLLRDVLILYNFSRSGISKFEIYIFWVH